MIIINTEKLKELKPCTERFKNWLENYSEFNGDFCEFLDLDKITYGDKIYVVKRIVPREVLEEWAVLCAESVLYIFENKYPNDKRPRECIEHLKTKEKNKDKLIEFRRKCYAAYDAAADAAYAAAYAAYAAVNAVNAADAAAYAAYAAVNAVNAAAYAASDSEKEKQKSKNLEFLKLLLKKQIMESNDESRMCVD